MAKALHLMILRGLAQLFALRGDTKTAKVFKGAAALLSSGRNVDAYAQTVADKLERGEDIDADELIARIEKEGDEFQRPTTDTSSGAAGDSVPAEAKDDAKPDAGK